MYQTYQLRAILAETVSIVALLVDITCIAIIVNARVTDGLSVKTQNAEKNTKHVF